MLVLNIGASLLAFYAFIKFLDDVVLWFGHFAGWDKLSFSYILGYILYPVAFLIGIEGKVWEIQNTMCVNLIDIKKTFICRIAKLLENWLDRKFWSQSFQHFWVWLTTQREERSARDPSRLRPTPCAGSPISPASGFKSEGSVPWRQSGSRTLHRSRWEPW